MRYILFDWVLKVHKAFKLSQQTLYISFWILEKIQSKIFIKRKEYQLYAITSLYIASKMEDIKFPSAKKFSFICDSAYTTKQINLAEFEILKILNYNSLLVTPLNYLEIFLSPEDMNSQLYNLSN